ncbi:nucleoprotein TPR-like [Brevipalpus obovatus]|uniref:nucleoprotein TPR-like n=1 Tax=Brevipalpus obovatus TaxID=246614 RepID=UPI003D9F926B
MISDTERENNFLKIKYEMAEEFSLQLKRQLKNVEDTLQKSRREFYDVVIEKEGLVNELEMLKIKVKRMEEEKSNADFLLECKNKEIRSIQDVVKNLTLRLESSGKNEMENTIKSEDIRMRELSLELQERRIQHERDFYQKQMDALENEINQHVKESKDYQRQKTTQIMDLESRLDLANDQIKRLSEESNHFKQLSDKKDQHIDDLAHKIRELNEATNQMESHFQNEIKELKNIIDMNEVSLEKERKMAKELVENLSEMQNTLIQSHQAQEELDQTLKQFNEGYEKNLNSKNEVIAELEEQITKLKAEAAAKVQEEFEDQMDIYFPSASSTCKIFNSNMTLSEFYHEYRLLSHRLEEEASEKNRLKEQVRELIAEAEQRGPFIHHKINENKRNAQIVGELQGAVSALISEKEQLIADKEESEQLVKHLQRELQRQEQHIIDTKRQVASLLKSVCQLQNIPMSDSSEPLVDVSTGTANDIITQRLITYSDLNDLLSKNDQMIVALRDLGARSDELSRELALKEAVSRQDMEKLQEEVKKLMEERQRQTMILEELTQKRDGPRSRLSIDSEMRSPIKSSVSSAKNTVDDAISDMKMTLKKMADEASIIRAESDQKIKDLNEEIAGMREKITSLEAEKAKIESLNEFNQEKTKVLQANFETVKKENSAYNERNNKLCQKIAKLEGNNKLLKTQLTEIEAVRKRLEASIAAIQSERELLRNNERLLTQERDSLRREYEEKSKLIVTFQSIQANFQRLESESAKGLHLQIEKLERELASAKSLLDATEKDKRDSVQIYSKQISDLQLKINEEIHNNARINEELYSVKQKLHGTEVELRILKAAQANQPPPPPQPQPIVQPQPIIRVKEKLVDNPKLIAKIKELESALEASKKEVASLKNELQTSATRAEKLKTLSDQARQRLSLIIQQKKDLTKERDDLAKKVRELEAAIVAPPPRRLNLRNESNEELNRKLAEVEGKLNQMTTLNKSLNNDKEILQKELNDLKAKITSLENVISQEKNSAKESYHEVARKLEEAESKMSALTSLNNSLSNEKDNFVKEMDELKSKISSLEQQISIERESSQNSNRELTQNLEESQQRIKSIVAVNESLTAKNITLMKATTSLKNKITSLETQIAEESSNLAKLKSQYDGQVRQLQRLCDESKEKLAQQTLELDSLHNQIAFSQSSNISMPSISSSSNPSNSATPVRHPVLPQKQESSPSITIPTASIRPLVAPGPSSSSSSSPRVATRPATPNVRATVVPVQPEPHQFEQVPQATVTPTHSQTVVVPPSSATSGPMSTTDSTPYDSSIYPSSSRHLGSDSVTGDGNADSKLVSSSQDSLPEPIESTSRRDQDTHLGHKRQRLTQSDSPDSKNSKKIRVEEEVVVESIGQDELSFDADDDTARNQDDERPYPSEDEPKHLRDDTNRSDEDAQVESQDAEEEAEDEECLDEEVEEEEEEEEEAVENDEEEGDGEGDGEDMEGLMHSRPESMHSEVDDEVEDEEADEHDVEDEIDDEEEEEEDEEHEDEVDGSEDHNQAVEEESADDDIVILNSDSEESGESQPAQQNFSE